MMEIDLLQEIESLRPKAPGMIMDMVSDAGIDVTPWSVTKDGAAVKNPRANPSYTYDLSLIHIQMCIRDSLKGIWGSKQKTERA